MKGQFGQGALKSAMTRPTPTLNWAQQEPSKKWFTEMYINQKSLKCLLTTARVQSFDSKNITVHWSSYMHLQKKVVNVTNVLYQLGNYNAFPNPVFMIFSL